MKYLMFFLAAAFFVEPNAIAAAVDRSQALETFAGRYRFSDSISGDRVDFKISSAGRVLMEENPAYRVARSTVQSLGSNLGPEGLSVMTVMLAGGSDEQAASLHIRLYPKQTTDTVVRLLDVVYFENDGPNNSTFAAFQPTAVYKYNPQTQTYEEITREQ